ncbi:hypothetical protein M0R45_017955 [Rubus argutus]|uniref:TIR domain-containing protein n=1 Tax=Rubus argutus TaxID=59490 RepID=A0AAW1XXF5_RUBAR
MDSITTEFGASSTSSTAQSWRYHVFLSFRGDDTRNNFVGHLHSNLVLKGIKTFLDDEELRRGEEISPELHKAIQESKISVVVFSKNYASSKWCLEELVKILQCKESKQQMVFPIFYKVDPSDVRHQRGTFGEALARHESRFKDDLEKVMIMRWREALSKAANLSGAHFLDGGHESKFIDAIVGEISAQLLNRTNLNVAKYPVGIESRVEDVLKLLCIGENDVHMVGIWGVGGIGKTTIAKAVYNSIAYQFEASCFLANVREESMGSGGFVHLQKNLLSEILGEKDLDLSVVDRGITLIKERMCYKRVLLILDDVNHVNQLDRLVGNPNWFGSGSRIIVTTRDKHCLSGYNVNEIYEVKKLSHHEALELFNFNAFQEHRHTGDYDELVNNVLLYAQGLPLALEVLGSNLRGRNVDQWKCALGSYRSLPKQEIQEILKISYDALEPLIKEVFLHIACFFKGKNKNYVMDVLEGCEFPKFGIEVLTEKALINITEANDIWMHDLLEAMGKEIVFQESPNEPGQRSRLWCYEDVSHVFVENTGTDKVQGIMVNNWNDRREKICLSSESFLKLKKLQVFIICGDIFTGDYVNYLSNELRLLDWFYCPLLSFPSSFNPKKLVVLNMPCSKMSPLGEVPKIIFGLKMPGSCTSPLGQETMQNLKSIDLSNCYGLTKLADFCKFPNLVDLNLSGCKTLVEVDPSIGFLTNLANLNLKFCEKLRKLEIMAEMKSLKSLDLGGTAIKELPSSIGYLINLEKLSLRECAKLTNVPCNIFELQHLQHLDLFWCDSLVTFPTKSESSTSSRTSLQEKHYDPLFVSLDSCTNLVEISEIPRDIDVLDVRCCNALKGISKLSNILEGKESKMARRMNLFACYALCHNLASDYMAKMNLPDNSDQDTALLSLFLSCRQSEFVVSYPYVSGLPNWFFCRKKFISSCFQAHEFRIEIPGNFKWENKGLAFCARSSRARSFKGAHLRLRFCSIHININDVCVITPSRKPEDRWWRLSRGHAWLYYIPFDTIIRQLSDSGLPPPSMCRVKLEFEFKRGELEKLICGVQVVTPEEDGVILHQVHNAEP